MLPKVYISGPTFILSIKSSNNMSTIFNVNFDSQQCSNGQILCSYFKCHGISVIPHIALIITIL